MIKPEIIDQLAKALADFVPPQLHHVKQDLEKNFRALLQSQLTDMNIVSREEFDIQSQVLAKTRQKLAVLEKQVADLEKKNTF